MLLVHLFVVVFLHALSVVAFSLPLGVKSLLQLVIVAFPGSFLFEPRHEKTCLCHMRTIKAQTSLRIHRPR